MKGSRTLKTALGLYVLVSAGAGAFYGKSVYDRSILEKSGESQVSYREVGGRRYDKESFDIAFRRGLLTFGGLMLGPLFLRGVSRRLSGGIRRVGEEEEWDPRDDPLTWYHAD